MPRYPSLSKGRFNAKGATLITKGNHCIHTSELFRLDTSSFVSLLTLGCHPHEVVQRDRGGLRGLVPGPGEGVHHPVMRAVQRPPGHWVLERSSASRRPSEIRRCSPSPSPSGVPPIVVHPFQAYVGSNNVAPSATEDICCTPFFSPREKPRTKCAMRRFKLHCNPPPRV